MIRRRLPFVVVLAATVFVHASALAQTSADSADDICGPSVDPCNITKGFDIVDGSVLDFGTRTVQLLTGGELDTNVGTAILKCGKFVSETGTAAGLKVRGPSGFGTIDGGNLILEANRRCDENQNTACIKDSECDFGTCTAAVCSLDRDRRCLDAGACQLGDCGATVCSRDSNRLCSDDPTCDVGPCNLTSRRCVQDSTVVCFSNSQCNFGPCALGDARCEGDLATSCTTNGDCNLGTCSVDVCTELEDGVYRECNGDSDCQDGVCSIGDGSVRLNGRARADGIEPGSIAIRAAGDIDVLQTITVNANSGAYDGGFLELESGQGSITLAAAITAYGGGQSQGGEVDMMAGQDITINAAIDANGGDFDGGFVEFLAGRDLRINASLAVSSILGSGLGGEIDGSADRDIIIGGTTTLFTNGHQSNDNFGGDGGPQSFYAGRNLTVGSGVKMEATGAAPDGFGEDVYFEADADMSLAAQISAAGRGAQGAGGTIAADVEGALTTTGTSVFTVTGGAAGGGAVDFFAAGNIGHAGLIDGRATNSGTPDSVLIVSEADFAMTGDVLLGGGPTGIARGDVEIEACRLNLNSGTLISNLGGKGTTTLIGHERINVNSGASVVNASDGTNLFRDRDENKPPTVVGIVTPAFEGEVVPSLSGCPICGNLEIEGGESCDDGNKVGGDGCSATCQDEGCVAQTPGYPSVPLCDDGEECTIDTCNPETHACEHELSCDDGNECTVDTCVAEACVHDKNNLLCDDDNPCTLDICGSFGCTYGLESGPCDDGLGCTTNDACFSGECRGTDTCPDGQACSTEAGVCVDEGGGCGDPTNDGSTTASDALFALNAAVGLLTCQLCVCDVDSSSSLSASDALRVLNFAVGIPNITLNCPAC
jgi:cysteine-rich repeat protein